MFLRIVVFCRIIHSVISISNQEDLSISTYAHIGCLLLKSDQQFISNSIQYNTLLPYQSYSGSNLSIDLCFRLCRRWIILMNVNHTNCICLYTINELHEMNEYFGDVSSSINCSRNSLKIYSLTDNPYLFPSPTPNDDWSFDGCYYLHGIQTYHANFQLIQMDYIQAMDSCRRQCQTIRSPTYFSFFLSMKKLCYCLPIKLSPTITTIGVRKPIIHCSFLPYIKQKLNNYSFNSFEINSDTVVKINVQRYCFSSFIFDRNLYICLKLILLNELNSYSRIIGNEGCSPVLIKTIEQWTHLLSLLPLQRTRIFIWIDQNSTYIIEDLFKQKVNSFQMENLCLVINRTQSINYDLIPCSVIQSLGYIFCSQKPFQSINYNQSELQSIKSIAIIDNITCPTDFVLFNNLCYYVDTSFVYSIQHGRQVCTDRYANSTLVKLHSQQWSNVNSTRFLGRTLDDILLEFFYYQLEQKLIIENRNNTKNKHWLRLLVGQKINDNECVLRYFIRSLGAFTILHQCNQGGHPVCQTQPILIIETKTSPPPPEIETITESTTITLTVRPLLFSPNETADEDLMNNETEINSLIDFNNSTLIQTKVSYSNHRSWLRIVILLLLVFLVIVLISITFIVIRFVRRRHGFYSTHQSNNSSSRIKTSTTNSSKLPVVLYTRLKSSSPSVAIDSDMTNSFDNAIINDDNIHLLPSSIDQINSSHHTVKDDEEEHLYATLKTSNEK